MNRKPKNPDRQQAKRDLARLRALRKNTPTDSRARREVDAQIATIEHHVHRASR